MSLTRAEVVAYLEGLGTHELGELIDELQRRLGLRPVPPVERVAMGAPLVMGMLDEHVYRVVLLGYTESRRIEMMKAIREVRPLGIVEAKLFIDSAPVEVGEFDYRSHAQALADRLQAAGGKVEIR
ncbi:MAG: ribosomal protein L7/L12 [Myxococcales bacterium]|nr:ribosomal protein L7/L12 [Myxococcales bacterium]